MVEVLPRLQGSVPHSQRSFCTVSNCCPREKDPQGSAGAHLSQGRWSAGSSSFTRTPQGLGLRQLTIENHMEDAVPSYPEPEAQLPASTCWISPAFSCMQRSAQSQKRGPLRSHQSGSRGQVDVGDPGLNHRWGYTGSSRLHRSVEASCHGWQPLQTSSQGASNMGAARWASSEECLYRACSAVQRKGHKADSWQTIHDRHVEHTTVRGYSRCRHVPVQHLATTADHRPVTWSWEHAHIYYRALCSRMAAWSNGVTVATSTLSHGAAKCLGPR